MGVEPLIAFSNPRRYNRHNHFMFPARFDRTHPRPV